jgi:excisionase family DNA binding protein
MSSPLLTVEQVAQQLGLHTKTVLRYIREGRLGATKIGKSYRVSRTECDAFVGLSGSSVEAQVAARTTCITDLAGITVEAAERMATFLQAAAMTGDANAPPLHLQTAYDSLAKTLKVVVLGSPSDVAALLQMLHLHLTSRG